MPELPRLGIAIRKPRGTPAVFFLRFDGEAAARGVAEILAADGFAVEVEREPGHWLVAARREIRKDSFDVAVHALEVLAVAHGGRQAGFRVEPPPTRRAPGQ
jgi:hypothetical protein